MNSLDSTPQLLSLVKNEIRKYSPESLQLVATWGELLKRLGLNNENPHELPLEVLESWGFGLRIYQYPNQFSRFMAFLANRAESIRSYLEIGTRHGGTFLSIVETLSYLNPDFRRAVAVDIIERPQVLKQFEYIREDSTSPEFTRWLEDKFFDLVFIDGDHSYEAVKHDAESTFERSNIQVFHDITSDACPAVGRYWKEYVSNRSTTHEFYEFTDQYDEIVGSYFGLGVAVRKTPMI